MRRKPESRNGWISLWTGMAALAATSVLSAPVHAGELIANATITRIATIVSNTPGFAVQVSGGTGLCGTGWISFPPSAAPDVESHKRAYAAVTTALAMGLRVRIYNYANDSCTGASYVEIYQ